jgi:hypothetical protein
VARIKVFPAAAGGAAFVAELWASAMTILETGFTHLPAVLDGRIGIGTFPQELIP